MAEKSRHQEHADRLEFEHGHTGEHESYSVEAWQNAVASDDICEGYWEWVASQIEAADDARYAARLRAGVEAL